MKRVKSGVANALIEVDDITSIVDVCESLDIGDLVAETKDGVKKLYRVSTRGESQLVLSYVDNEKSIVVSYERDENGVWSYDETQTTELGGSDSLKIFEVEWDDGNDCPDLTGLYNKLKVGYAVFNGEIVYYCVYKDIGDLTLFTADSGEVYYFYYNSTDDEEWVGTSKQSFALTSFVTRSQATKLYKHIATYQTSDGTLTFVIYSTSNVDFSTLTSGEGITIVNGFIKNKKSSLIETDIGPNNAYWKITYWDDNQVGWYGFIMDFDNDKFATDQVSPL